METLKALVSFFIVSKVRFGLWFNSSLTTVFREILASFERLS